MKAGLFLPICNLTLFLLDVAEETETVVREKLAQASCLYISDGNTFYLLQELKRKNLLPLIRERIN